MDTLRLCHDLLHAMEAGARNGRDHWLQRILDRLRSELRCEFVGLGEVTGTGVRRASVTADGFDSWERADADGLAAVSDLGVLAPGPISVLAHPAVGAEFAGQDEAVRSFLVRRVPRVPGPAWLVAADICDPPAWTEQAPAVLDLGIEVMAAALAQESRIAEAENLAMTDGLTLIPNYRHLREVLRAEMDRARRYGEVFSVVMVDVDNLKQYNAAHGHLAGSEILQMVAGILRQDVRGADTVAKYGGDEFLIVLPRTLATGALALSERIRRRVNERLVGRGGEKISCSFGVASFPKDGFDYEGLIASADRVLYEAKHQGRNRVVWTGEVGTGGVRTGPEAEKAREMTSPRGDG